MTDAHSRLDNILNQPLRKHDRWRDSWRKPKDTLEFFQIEETMTICEIWPCAGWYTRILGPFLAANGRFYAANFDADHHERFLREQRAEFIQFAREHPAEFATTTVTEFGANKLNPCPQGSCDLIICVLHLHNFLKGGYEKEALAAFHRGLKDDGHIGIVQHRADTLLEGPMDGSRGYLREDDVVELFQNNGFEFLARSEIAKNKKDTKDYTEGAWALVPSLRGADTEEIRNERIEIGETDRMTLLFRKVET